MLLRSDAPFKKLLREVRQFDHVRLSRTGQPGPHPAVSEFVAFNAQFSVNERSLFHRDLASLAQLAFNKGWIPRERVVLNNMQNDTNLFFSSGMGADAIRALEHMKRVQNIIAKMK